MGHGTEIANTWIYMEKIVEMFTPEKIHGLVKRDKIRYFLEADVEHPKELHENHNELLFYLVQCSDL